MNADEQNILKDPFVRAVNAIIQSDESKFFIEWLVRNQQEAIRAAASSTNPNDMLKIAGRIYEYDFILSAVSDAANRLGKGDIELFVSDAFFARMQYAKQKTSLWKKFLNLFRLRGTASSEPQHKI
jgi:hypothetical protein|nr:MAG TPA: hypothetical protein [Caudoviricetes sp.]